MLWLKTLKSQLDSCILLLSTLSYTWNIAVAFQSPDQQWVPVVLNAAQTEIKRNICFGEIKSTLRQDLYPPGETCSCRSAGWQSQRQWSHVELLDGNLDPWMLRWGTNSQSFTLFVIIWVQAEIVSCLQSEGHPDFCLP